MKQLILFLLLLPGFAVAQSDVDEIRKMKEKNDSLTALLQQIDSLTQLRIMEIREITEAIEAAKTENAESIVHLRKENEALRQILINYVKQIDQLNELNLQLERELNECRKKDELPEKEKKE